MRALLLLALVGSVCGASFSFGPEGISSTPINLATVIRTVRNVWNAFTAAGQSGVPATQQREAADTATSDYDTSLESLKSRIEAASSAASYDAASKQRITRKRGEKIYGEQDVEQPALTRAIFAKKKIKVSKWPIVYGIINIGLIIAIIVLAVPYFKEGETIVDEYAKKKRQQEVVDDEAMYSLYTTESMYGGYGTGPVDPPPPVYPLNKMYSDENTGGYQAQSKLYENKRKETNGGGGKRPAYPYAAQPNVPPYRHHKQPQLQQQYQQLEQYEQPHQDGGPGTLTSHTMVFHEPGPYLRYTDAGRPPPVLRYSESPQEESSFYARSGEVPLNELNYFNPTVFTSSVPSSYGCLEKMVCQDPDRSGRALESIRAASREMSETASWQSVADRINRAAQVGRESGDCAMYYCPPQLPNSKIFEQGDSYAPPPAMANTHSGSQSVDHSLGEIHDVSASPYLLDEGVSTMRVEESGIEAGKSGIRAGESGGSANGGDSKNVAEASNKHSKSPANIGNDVSELKQPAPILPGGARIVQLIQAPRINRPVHYSKISDQSGSAELGKNLPPPVVIGTSSVVAINTIRGKSEIPNKQSRKIGTQQSTNARTHAGAEDLQVKKLDPVLPVYP